MEAANMPYYGSSFIYMRRSTSARLSEEPRKTRKNSAAFDRSQKNGKK
jgi:hypothetical protein